MFALGALRGAFRDAREDRDERRLPEEGSMKRNWKRRAMVGVSVTAASVGLGAAVVDATGLNGHHREHAGAERHSHREGAAPAARHAHRGGNFATAAAYLGMTRAELRHRLHGEHTVGAVAQSTPGKSVVGLEGALVNAKLAKLSGVRSTSARPASRRQAKLSKLRTRAAEWAEQTRPRKGRGTRADRAARRHARQAGST
jgi:hypothetical protein